MKSLALTQLELKINGPLRRSNLNCLVATVLLCVLCGACTGVKPVTPNASPEAVALLQYIHDISGQRTMTGQHNFPNTTNGSTARATILYGKVPAIFGQDFGFAKPGDKDAADARPQIIAEVKRQYALGSIITLCWHAVRPTDDEPVTFRDSVQGKLTDRQFDDVLTPGTELYRRWCAQVDVIAGFLKELQAEHVPVLWRPYHEMNGDWFWWGGRRGARGTATLYRQIYDRFVNYHHLNNLVWIWSVDLPSKPDRQFVDYFPGKKYFDIAALDVYRNHFDQTNYVELLRLAGGKPIALAEVGPPPAVSVLDQQPRWAWWMSWAGRIGGNVEPAPADNAVKILFNDPRSLSLTDPGYLQLTAPIRAASGLPPLPSMAPVAR